MEEYDKYIVGFGVGLLFLGDSNYPCIFITQRHPDDRKIIDF